MSCRDNNFTFRQTIVLDKIVNNAKNSIFVDFFTAATVLSWHIYCLFELTDKWSPNAVFITTCNVCYALFSHNSIVTVSYLTLGRVSSFSHFLPTWKKSVPTGICNDCMIETYVCLCITPLRLYFVEMDCCSSSGNLHLHIYLFYLVNHTSIEILSFSIDQLRMLPVK